MYCFEQFVCEFGVVFVFECEVEFCVYCVFECGVEVFWKFCEYGLGVVYCVFGVCIVVGDVVLQFDQWQQCLCEVVVVLVCDVWLYLVCIVVVGIGVVVDMVCIECVDEVEWIVVDCYVED